MTAIGERFSVPKIYEVRNARKRLLARYLPGFDYRVTPRNMEVVDKMIVAGDAIAGGSAALAAANRLATRPVRVSGRVASGPKKAKAKAKAKA